MLTEHEILSQHQAALRQAREHCVALQRNMVEVVPRGHRSIELRACFRRLEGSARQMAHWRGDSRWLTLGFVYGRLADRIGGLVLREKWPLFGEIAKQCEGWMRKADELAHRRTEKPGTLILPHADKKGHLILPPQMVQ